MVEQLPLNFIFSLLREKSQGESDSPPQRQFQYNAAGRGPARFWPADCAHARQPSVQPRLSLATGRVIFGGKKPVPAQTSKRPAVGTRIGSGQSAYRQLS